MSEWTHQTPGKGLANDMNAHSWPSTMAAALFEAALADPVTGRRFATSRGIAFEAKATKDGTWHGYPVPGESVPPKLVREWLDMNAVTRRQTREFLKVDRDDIHWALKTDDR